MRSHRIRVTGPGGQRRPHRLRLSPSGPEPPILQIGEATGDALCGSRSRRGWGSREPSAAGAAAAAGRGASYPLRPALLRPASCRGRGRVVRRRPRQASAPEQGYRPGDRPSRPFSGNQISTGGSCPARAAGAGSSCSIRSPCSHPHGPPRDTALIPRPWVIAVPEFGVPRAATPKGTWERVAAKLGLTACPATSTPDTGRAPTGDPYHNGQKA